MRDAPVLAKVATRSDGNRARHPQNALSRLVTIPVMATAARVIPTIPALFVINLPVPAFTPGLTTVPFAGPCRPIVIIGAVPATAIVTIKSTFIILSRYRHTCHRDNRRSRKNLFQHPRSPWFPYLPTRASCSQYPSTVTRSPSSDRTRLAVAGARRANTSARVALYMNSSNCG